MTSDEIWTILVDGFGSIKGKIDEIRVEPLVGADRFEKLKDERSALVSTSEREEGRARYYQSPLSPARRLLSDMARCWQAHRDDVLFW